MSTTYNFTKVTGGATIISEDGAFNEFFNTPVLIKYNRVKAVFVFRFDGDSTGFEIAVADIGNVNGAPYSGTLDAFPATIGGSVFPEATSGGSVSPGAWYLRGDATTLNSVRINIIGTAVKVEKYDGSVWNEVTTLADPV